MKSPEDNSPEQEVIPPGQPDHFNRWEQTRQQFQSHPLLLRFPLWGLLAIPLLFMLIWGVYIYAGFVGFAFYSSGLIAFFAVCVCLYHRFMPFLLVGAYIAASEVWDWELLTTIFFLAGAIPVVLVPMLIKKRFSSLWR